MKFRVHPSVSHIQAMLANMEERTGMNLMPGRMWHVAMALRRLMHSVPS